VEEEQEQQVVLHMAMVLLQFFLLLLRPAAAAEEIIQDQEQIKMEPQVVQEAEVLVATQQQQLVEMEIHLLQVHHKEIMVAVEVSIVQIFLVAEAAAQVVQEQLPQVQIEEMVVQEQLHHIQVHQLYMQAVAAEEQEPHL
jgi:hypothetical protein